MTMYSQTLLLQLKGTYKPPTATHHNLAAGLSRATFPRPQLSCSCCGSCFVLLSLLSVWLQLFILSFPTNNSSSISSVNPSWVLALPPSSPTQSNDVRTARLLSWRWEGVLDRDYKGTGSVKIPYWLTHQRPPFTLLFCKWEGWGKKKRGEERGNDKLRKLFGHLWNLLWVSLSRRREGGVSLSSCWATLWTKK